MNNKQEVSIFWFRRDLRLTDNHGLFKALNSENEVLPIFIFDTEILNQLDDKSDRRVNLIFSILENLNNELQRNYKSGIQYYYGLPEKIFLKLINDYKIKSVYCNEDYEPYAISRDLKVKSLLSENSILFSSFKDQVIFHKSDIVKKDGAPYTIYSPYANSWLKKFTDNNLEYYPSENKLDKLYKFLPINFILEHTGFKKTGIEFKSPIINTGIIKNYDNTRNFPFLLEGVSHMSVHLRFGTISIRILAKMAFDLNLIYLKELIWREFFMQILFNFPQVQIRSFKMKYDNIKWELNEYNFLLWCEGKTGYPIVDAGMRELNATGYMHNRVRMITASFLTKHLLIDWRWGESYFASKLTDFELASNNGNWQWAAGCGCDAAPYFRIFNPWEQQRKFDPDKVYIKKWISEYETKYYPSPIIDHNKARNRAILRYKSGLEF